MICARAEKGQAIRRHDCDSGDDMTTMVADGAMYNRVRRRTCRRDWAALARTICRMHVREALAARGVRFCAKTLREGVPQMRRVRM